MQHNEQILDKDEHAFIQNFQYFAAKHLEKVCIAQIYQIEECLLEHEKQLEAWLVEQNESYHYEQRPAHQEDE